MFLKLAVMIYNYLICVRDGLTPESPTLLVAVAFVLSKMVNYNSTDEINSITNYRNAQVSRAVVLHRAPYI